MGFIKDLFGGGPSPTEISATQGAANEETARLQAQLNRPNVYTPYGSNTWSRQGDTWTSTSTLSPQQQRVFDEQNKANWRTAYRAKRLARDIPTEGFDLEGINAFQGDINRRGLPGLQSSVNAGGLQRGLRLGGLADLDTDFEGASQRASDAAYEQVMERARPELERQRSSLETQLANQGITSGSDAYNTEMERFQQGVNDLQNQAAFQSVNAGEAMRRGLFADTLSARGQQFGERMGAGQFANTAQQQAFQQGLTNAGLAGSVRSQLLGERTNQRDMRNQARQQQIDDRLLTRNQRFNELAALLQGSPAIQTPGPMSTGGASVQPTDVTGAYALEQSRNNAAMGGLFGLGGTLGAAYMLR